MRTDRIGDLAVGAVRRAGAGAGLHLSVRSESGGRTVVVATGTVDIDTAPRLRVLLIALVQDHRHHLVVDLDGVDLVDATGLGVLVGGLRRATGDGGSLVLVCSGHLVLATLRTTGLLGLLPVFPSVQGALAADGA